MASQELPHTVTSFDDDLHRLRSLVVQMGALAHAQVSAAIEALANMDDSAATAVAASDALIDRLQSINGHIAEMTARHDAVGYIRRNLEFHRTLYLRAQAPAMPETMAGSSEKARSPCSSSQSVNTVWMGMPGVLSLATLIRNFPRPIGERAVRRSADRKAAPRDQEVTMSCSAEVNLSSPERRSTSPMGRPPQTTMPARSMIWAME